MGRPAARLGDATTHGSTLLSAACMTVLIGGEAAWRIAGQHMCVIPNAPPPVADGAPHGLGITNPGPGAMLTTIIGGKPVACLGDIVMEPHALVPLPLPNPIVPGEPAVLIG